MFAHWSRRIRIGYRNAIERLPFVNNKIQSILVKVRADFTDLSAIIRVRRIIAERRGCYGIY